MGWAVRTTEDRQRFNRQAFVPFLQTVLSAHPFDRRVIVVVGNPFRFPDGPFIEIGIEIAIEHYR